MTHQCLLRRATRAGIPLDCALVDHDRESEAGMGFRFRHDEFCGLVDVVVWTIPIDDDAVDSTADHVRDLIVNLLRVCRTVADIHVVRPSEPQEQMSIDLRVRARIEQRMHIHFAYVAGSGIAVGLLGKNIGSAGIVRRLGCERGSGHDIVSGHTYTGNLQQQRCDTEHLSKHLSSGAEEPRPCRQFSREARCACRFLGTSSLSGTCLPGIE